MHAHLQLATEATRWRPLLDGDDARRATAVAQEIAADLVGQRFASAEPSLFGGEAGMALALDYLDRVWPDAGHRVAADERLERASEAVATFPLPPTLAGFLGVAAAVELIHGSPEVDDDEDPNSEIDAALIRFLRPPWPAVDDLIEGLVGVGVYALLRLQRPGARQILARVIDQLDARAQRRHGGLAWFTPPHFLPEAERAKHPAGYYNLGLAHGNPAMIALCARALAADVAVERAAALLDGARRYFATQRLADGHYANQEGSDQPSRLAWCYGNLGNAVALLGAARQLDDATLEADALAMAARALTVPMRDSGVVDAGLCHGSCGIAHLWNRLYQATGDAAFAEAARSWFRVTLDNRRQSGFGGFVFLSAVDGAPGYRADPSLLTGSAGVAAMLAASVASVEPVWDRPFLIDVEQPRSQP